MSNNYFFGVVGSGSLNRSDVEKSWWCLPYNAVEGDQILLYCPRSVGGVAKNGIFAEAKVSISPIENRLENSYCSGFGYRGGARLGYAEIEIIERFTEKLTAKQMKSDPVLASTELVRRNFQGTTFSIDLNIYQRMKLLLINLVNIKK